MDESGAGNRNDFSGMAQGDVYQGHTLHIHQASRTDVPRELPPNPPVFVNRTAERDRLESLGEATEERQRPQVAVLSAKPGTGKTSLAVYAASLIQNGFPDGTVYIDCAAYGRKGRVEAADLADSALRSFGVPDEWIQGQAHHRINQLRTKTADKRVLMVLENVENRAVIEALLPSSARSAVIVTTSQRIDAIKRVTEIGIVLTPLSDRDAREMLAKYRVGLDTESDAARDLIGWCGGLPLALDLVGGLLDNHPDWSVRDVLAHLEEGPHMEEIAGLSYASLDENTRQLYRLLSVFPGQTFDRGDAAVVTGRPHEDVGPALEELRVAKLIKPVAGDRFAFPQLIRRHAERSAEADEARESRDAAVDRVIVRYRDLARYADQATGPRLRLGELMPGDNPFPGDKAALAWLNTMRESLIAVQRLAAMRGRPDDVWRFTQAMWRSFMARRSDASWRESNQLGLDAAVELGDVRVEARMRAQYGRWALAYGEPAEAEEYMRASIRLAESVGDNALHASGIEFLGRFLYFQDRFTEAIAANQRALELDDDRRAQGLNHQFIGQCHEALGDLETALEHLRIAEDLFRDNGDTQDRGKILSDLGTLHHRLGRTEQARAAFVASLEYLRAKDTTYYEANTLRAYGNLLLELGEQAEAREILGEALAFFRDAASPLSEEVAEEYARTGSGDGDGPASTGDAED